MEPLSIESWLKVSLARSVLDGSEGVTQKKAKLRLWDEKYSSEIEESETEGHEKEDSDHFETVAKC